jgi:hypothetical protein
MGQYFTPVILDSQDRITRAVEPGDYGSGANSPATPAPTSLS